MKNNVPTPDFTYNRYDPNFIAGIRPFRKETYRLEKEIIDGKEIIHNYGHGGAGVTMSWGCALEVKDLIDKVSIEKKASKIAVLGGGVIGLTSASILADAGYEVTVYSKDTTPKTTSNVAAAQWAPSIISYKNSEEEKFHRILRRSYNVFSSLCADITWGISFTKNYTWKKSASFERVPKDVIDDPIVLNKLPFKGIDRPGYLYKTFLIETQLFMPRLIAKLTAKGVLLQLKVFSSKDDVLLLDEDIIVNCTGLGSEEMFGDTKLFPIKGSLALLRPQRNLNYLYSGNGYIFPRQDIVILGGTAERGVYDPTPDPVICKGIIDYHRGVLDEGDESLIDNIPEIFNTDF